MISSMRSELSPEFFSSVPVRIFSSRGRTCAPFSRTVRRGLSAVLPVNSPDLSRRSENSVESHDSGSVRIAGIPVSVILSLLFLTLSPQNHNCTAAVLTMRRFFLYNFSHMYRLVCIRLIRGWFCRRRLV